MELSAYSLLQADSVPVAEVEPVLEIAELEAAAETGWELTSSVM